ncbi:MAG: DNA polymerase III subunit delta [Paracoccaceae bacterium]
MKLTSRDVVSFFKSPPKGLAGVLIYGNDVMRVSDKRQQFISSLLGPKADEEMRLTRISRENLKKAPEQAIDLCKAQGFFPGERALLIEEANETVADTIITAIEEWQDGDATIVVTAGSLKPSSSLRKFFEQKKNIFSVPIFDNPMTKFEVEKIITESGLQNVTQEILNQLVTIASELPPGDFKQSINKLALYKLNDATPVTYQDLINCTPTSNEAAIDEVLNVILAGNEFKINQIVGRLRSQGVLPVTLVIAATRHFKALFSIVSNPSGVSAGATALRPPIYGPRKETLINQAQKWGPLKIKTAIKILTTIDLKLRSADQKAPQMSLVERHLIRIAMLLKN